MICTLFWAWKQHETLVQEHHVLEPAREALLGHPFPAGSRSAVSSDRALQCPALLWLQRGDHTIRGALSLLVSKAIRSIFLPQLDKQPRFVRNELAQTVLAVLRELCWKRLFNKPLSFFLFPCRKQNTFKTSTEM